MYIYFWKISPCSWVSLSIIIGLFASSLEKTDPKRKRRTQAGIIGEPEEKIILLFFIDAPTRARERETPHPTKRERERKKERATLAEAVGREDPGESETK